MQKFRRSKRGKYFVTDLAPNLFLLGQELNWHLDTVINWNWIPTRLKHVNGILWVWELSRSPTLKQQGHNLEGLLPLKVYMALWPKVCSINFYLVLQLHFFLDRYLLAVLSHLDNSNTFHVSLPLKIIWKWQIIMYAATLIENILQRPRSISPSTIELCYWLGFKVFV